MVECIKEVMVTLMALSQSQIQMLEILSSLQSRYESESQRALDTLMDIALTEGNQGPIPPT